MMNAIQYFSHELTYAPDVWKLLNGIFCIFKPSKKSMNEVRSIILNKISSELNTLVTRQPENYVKIDGDANESLTVHVVPNLADHPLVVGPRYCMNDFKLTWSQNLHYNTSGVCVVAINKECRTMSRLLNKKLTACYHINGEFGLCTDTLYKEGKVIYRAKYEHITKHKIENVIASIQAAHQKKMFEYCGIPMNSQEAYEMCSKGFVRVAGKTPPILYEISLVDFNLPHFTIEIQCINEYETYFKHLVHDIGVSLKSIAVCTKVRCIRYGSFSLDLALLPKHWTLQNIIDSIIECRRLLIPLKSEPYIKAQQI